jgi:hypothetical protein
VALTAQQAASLKAIKERKNKNQEIGVVPMLVKAGINAPASAARFARDVVEPFLSPVDTAKAVVNLGSSVLGKIGVTDSDPTLANQVGNYFANRYGSVDNAMRTFAEDPVGMASDAAGLLTGGGAIAAKVPRLARLAGALEKTGRAVDPLNIAAKGAKATGKTTAALAGFTSGAGMRSVEEAAKAGYAGGSQGDAFVTQMRQPEKFRNVLDEAERAVDAVRQQRSRNYKAGMAGVSQDATVLDFAPVRNAFDQIKSMGQYAGRSGMGIAKSINEPAVAAVEKLEDIIGDWEFSDPKEFHTPEGFDALKKKIYNQSRGYAFGTPERVVADQMYNAVRQVVANQAPDYSRVMGAYEEASDLLKEFEKSLSLNDKATADTTLRKLQSILRNNANTNYGAREALGQELVQAGATNLMPGLAGQMMSSPTPRALSGQMTGVGTIVNAAQSFPGSVLEPTTLALMAATSPRVIGETAYAAGQVAGVPKKLAALLGQYGDTLSQQNPRLAPVIASTRKAIAAGKRVNPVYAQQLALQLSRLQEIDAERRKPITQEQE